MLDSLRRRFMLPLPVDIREIGIVSALGKIAKELAKISKTSMADLSKAMDKQ